MHALMVTWVFDTFGVCSQKCMLLGVDILHVDKAFGTGQGVQLWNVPLQRHERYFHLDKVVGAMQGKLPWNRPWQRNEVL